MARTARRLRTNKASAISAFRRLGLTRREAEVLLWITRGQSNAEIGASLCISPRTVKKHLEHIFIKLGVKTRLAAAVKAGAAGSAKQPLLLKKRATASRQGRISPINFGNADVAILPT